MKFEKKFVLHFATFLQHLEKGLSFIQDVAWIHIFLFQLIAFKKKLVSGYFKKITCFGKKEKKN